MALYILNKGNARRVDGCLVRACSVILSLDTKSRTEHFTIYYTVARSMCLISGRDFNAVRERKHQILGKAQLHVKSLLLRKNNEFQKTVFEQRPWLQLQLAVGRI